MRTVVRLGALALALASSGPLAGCAVRGSSFETLGIPTPEDRPGRSPVILGWAQEERSGWVIRNVRVDDQARPEWREETQTPAILYLDPGEHRFQLSAVQLSDPRDSSSRSRRRYRVPPFTVDLLEQQAQLCVIRVSGEDRLRPRVNCESYNNADEAEEVDEYADEDEMDEEGLDEDVEAPAPRPAQPQTAEPFTSLEPAAPAAPAPSPSTSAPAAGAPAEEEGVPSPFGPMAQPPAAPQAASGGETATAPAAVPQSPRRLTVEERVERLERIVETLVRELRARQR